MFNNSVNISMTGFVGGIFLGRGFVGVLMSRSVFRRWIG